MNFLDFCRAYGLVIDSLPPEGVWRRYKTTDKPQHRNGSAKFMGDHGFCQNHATQTEVSVWRLDGEGATPLRDEAQARRQREKERDFRARAIEGARRFWARSDALRGLHPYIGGKGLSALGCAGLRVSGDLLVVPVLIGDRMASLQTISPTGEKRFWPGAPVKAGVYVLARPRAAVTVIVEGLATGLAIYQSLMKASVVVAFDAGNLQPVVDRLRPRGSVVVAADNDHATQARLGINPGLEKARNAAELIGCGVAWPTDIEGSDWADAVKEWGAPANRRIEREILSAARYVT